MSEPDPTAECNPAFLNIGLKMEQEPGCFSVNNQISELPDDVDLRNGDGNLKYWNGYDDVDRKIQKIKQSDSRITEICEFKPKIKKKSYELSLSSDEKINDSFKECLKFKFPLNTPNVVKPESLKFDKKAGAGMCGETKMFYNVAENRKVVVKKVMNEAMSETEIKNLQHCDNENIVKFLGCVALKDGYGIVLEDAGESLFKFWTFKNPISHQGMMMDSHILGILKGLCYLQKTGRVHCDMKPENVCVTGKDVKIIDLGTCRKSDDPAPKCGFTKQYLSPRWNRDFYLYKTKGNNQPHITHKEDIYATGLIIHFMQWQKHPIYKLIHENLQADQIGIIQEFPPEFFKCAKSKILEKMLPEMLEMEPLNRWTADKLLNEFGGKLEESWSRYTSVSGVNEISLPTDIDLKRKYTKGIKAINNSTNKMEYSSHELTVNDLQISTSSN